MTKPTTKNLTRAEKVLGFIKAHIRVPEGEHVGKPLELEPFQEKFIRDIYDNPHGTRKAIMSVARKNGKTALLAALLLVHLVGTEAVKNTQLVSGAMSREQAALLFDLACKMIHLSPSLSRIIKIIPSSKKLIGMQMGTEYIALSAEGKTAHGRSVKFGIIDECGQVVGARSAFIEAIETSQGAHKDPLLIYISTQSANDSDYFSILIDDAVNSKDPKIVCHLYETPPEYDLLDEAGWRLANPALGKFRSISDMREQMKQAARMPSVEAMARNLLLNQRVSVNSPFISRNSWLDILGDVPPIEECSEVYGGLDLSSRNDLTAFVLIGNHGGRWYIYPHFWTPLVGLHERAKRDRAPYDVWVGKGFLNTTPSASIEYDWLANDISRITKGINLLGVAFDRWRIDVLRKEFDRIGLQLPLQDWGQGFKDMSPALEALEGKILNKTITHDGHPVLTMCANNSMLVKNPAGDRKLDKMKTSGRIDGMVALCMAAGLAERNHLLEGNLNDFINNPLRL